MSENTAAGIVIDTKAGMQYMTLLQIAGGLSIEIVTSMQMTRGESALQRAKRFGVVDPSSRSKKAALKATIGFLKEMNPEFEIKPSMQKALDYKK